MSESVRVLIADDHPLFRDGLAALLHAAAGIELTGAAATGAQAVELARTARPDVVLMDLRLPGLTGIEATRQIVADSPHTAVVMLSMFDDDDSVFAALRAGARGYLLKGADQEVILRAVHAAAAGEAIFGAGLASRVLAHFNQARPPGHLACG
jgi:DNA-binding NarL/FixJ family response regulator